MAEDYTLGQDYTAAMQQMGTRFDKLDYGLSEIVNKQNEHSKQFSVACATLKEHTGVLHELQNNVTLLNSRMNTVEARLGTIDLRLNHMDERLGKLETG